MITIPQAIKILIAFLIGVFLASLAAVLTSVPFLAFVVIAVIILILRMVGNPDAVFVAVGVVVGVLATLLLPGLSVGAEPFLVYVAALWLILKV